MTKEAILLVEADILVRHPLAEYLRDCGYIVVEAASAAEARALVSSGELSFDGALVDAASVGDEAFAFVQWLRQSHPATSVSITGNIEKIANQAVKLCHDAPSLTKPLDHRAVLDQIKRMLAARQRR